MCGLGMDVCVFLIFVIENLRNWLLKLNVIRWYVLFVEFFGFGVNLFFNVELYGFGVEIW